MKLLLKDFLTFRRMLIPYLVQCLFWITVLGCIAMAIFNFYHGLIVPGLTILIIGPIITRLICEYIVVLFEINDTLLDIKQTINSVAPSSLPLPKSKDKGNEPPVMPL